eukprot:TRINITY_DN14083_c0_g1_i1.p1 TRINITY_DN14083_c0_g1~~TRINITY_DN14083_c0_g1_i1.p1  ORF type:complete len:592 (-),score=245.15 TRINITY_DN14083_c0_g1_i1:86-1840(-)
MEPTNTPPPKPEEGAAKKGPSKKELAKMQKAAERAEREKKQKEEEEKKLAEIRQKYGHLFGDRPLVEKKAADEAEKRVYTSLADLSESHAGQTVLIRARVQNSRPVGGKLCFLLLRQSTHSLQGIVEVNEDPNVLPREMVKFIAGVPRESIVDVVGVVNKVGEKIESATHQFIEVKVQKFFVISSAVALPIQYEDVSRPQALLNKQREEIEAIEAELNPLLEKLQAEKDEAAKKELETQVNTLQAKKSAAQKFAFVKQDLRLDNRVIDLRTAANQAIFKLQSATCFFFRQALLKHGFVEIHTPKLISAKSEGGANVFTVTYFDRPAYLAQSPQLYKQMAIVADMDRVFEIGPVFRAENSNTPRHLTEFTGLDMEMQIKQHYHEVLDVIEDMFMTIFEGLNTQYKHELVMVSHQFPYEPFQFKKLRLTFPEAVKLVNEANDPEIKMGDFDDFSTPAEKLLGRIVKEKYQTDFFVVDKFPSAVRPFYTMLDAEDARYSNSYDFFMRGQEIISGAQRIHDPNVLESRAKALGIEVDTIKAYLDCFKFGAPPHGGCGVGLERVVQFFLNLDNIRRTSMFPRDPERLTP